MAEAPLHVWLLCGCLLGCSGTFSALETAFFSLSFEHHPEVGPHARKLLEKPRALLITLLLGNLVVNLLFFAFANRIELPWAPHSELASGLVALVVLLVFGEILPKTLALRAPVRIARAGAAPLEALVRFVAPMRRVIGRILDVALAALGESGRDEHAITSELLGRVLGKSAETGELAGVEADILSEIVELGGMRVREIMTPRVDALVLDLAQDPAPLVREALRLNRSWIPVTDGGKDRVVGSVRVRDLVLRRDRPLRRLVQPVKFVPEVASVLDLLHQFREDRAAEAVVIDEYGGMAGVVTIEEVFEEIVGDLRAEGEAREQPVVPLGEGRFRVAGRLSIRDWNDEFGFRVVPTEFETVGGFVTALLGRIPRAGDRVEAAGLLCEVHEVRGRRVLSVDISVQRDELEEVAR